jgi:hypothetical protein
MQILGALFCLQRVPQGMLHFAATPPPRTRIPGGSLSVLHPNDRVRLATSAPRPPRLLLPRTLRPRMRPPARGGEHMREQMPRARLFFPLPLSLSLSLSLSSSSPPHLSAAAAVPRAPPRACADEQPRHGGLEDAPPGAGAEEEVAVVAGLGGVDPLHGPADQRPPGGGRGSADSCVTE